MSIAAKQAAKAVDRKLQDALDALDNFEALHRLTPAQSDHWYAARAAVLKAMGCMIAVDFLTAAPSDPCEACDGEGNVWNNADPASGQRVDCEVCK